MRSSLVALSRGLVVALLGLSQTACMASIGRDWRESPRRAIREPVTARAVGGDVRVTAAPLGAKALSVGGDIRIRSAERFVRARSFGGSVDVDAVRGDAHLVSYGGDIRLRVLDDSTTGTEGRDIEITAYGGDVLLYVPADWPMTLRVEVEYFRNDDGWQNVPVIDSDLTLVLRGTREWDRRMLGILPPSKRITGDAKSGDGRNRVRIRSEGGNVRLRYEPRAEPR